MERCSIEALYMTLDFAVKFRRAVSLNIMVFGYLISFFLGFSKYLKDVNENRALKKCDVKKSP